MEFIKQMSLIAYSAEHLCVSGKLLETAARAMLDDDKAAAEAAATLHFEQKCMFSNMMELLLK